MELVAVAAVSENGVIGDDGEIPWPSLPADKRQYRDRVADAPVILGRVTFESMLDDLPGASQIVVSRSVESVPVETATVAPSPEAAIELAESTGAETAYVLGGAGIYAVFLTHFDRMILSRVPGEYEGDARYPDFDEDEWRLVEETPQAGFTLERWVRTG